MEVARSSRYRGRENLAEVRRNRHRGRNERTVRGSPRVTASRKRRSRVMRQKRKDVMASVPARIVRARAECPFVVSSCRNRQATSGPK